MSLVANIAASYRHPGDVLGRMLGEGAREDRALALCMGGCGAMFVAQWPRLAREAHLSGEDLQMLLGGALLGVVFILPLALYLLAGLSHGVARLLGGRGTGYGARLALFWALVAATPLMLLHGLVAGFIGPGAAKGLIGLAWCLGFGWIWLAGLRRAEFGAGTVA
ncbi:YIP1 family protein [Pseudooceanicola sp. 200-1SW]|uniref:YIP1 family protein n=1 Tax=Pseudooceanicola sp. 200-1SW TaxID=3425949 RepID=UPI003D7F7D54